MILAALLLTLAPQGSTHAALHPADASLFLEVPDMTELLAAYDGAPLLQMLADKQVQETLGSFGVPAESLDLAKVLPGAIASMMPEGIDASTVTGMNSLSVSLTLSDGGGEPTFHAVVDYTTAEFATMAAKTANELQARAAADPTESDHTKVKVHSDGPRVIATNVADGATLGLHDDATYKRCGTALGAGSGVTVVRGFSREGPYEMVRAATLASGEEMDSQLEMLQGVAGMARFRMQLREGRFVTEVFLPDDGEEANALVGAKPVQSDWLTPVPEGQMFVYSAALDGNAIAAKVSEMLGEGIGAKLAGPLAKVGPGFVAYAEPVQGIGMPRTFSWIEVEDAAAFQEEITTLIADAGQLVQGLGAKTRDYRVKDAASGERLKIPITTITLPPEIMAEVPIPGLSPSFAIHEGKMLASLSSMHVKKELKRLYSGEVMDATTNPLAKSGFAYPKDARSVIWMDWGALIDGLVSLARSAGPMLAGFAGGELPFDFEQIPPPETFTRFYRPTFHYSQRVEGGLYRYHEASFGPETWLGIAGAIASAIEFGSEPTVHEFEFGGSIESTPTDTMDAREPIGGGAGG